MKRVIILDLYGVVFQPINGMVARTAFQRFGYAKGAALGACYKAKKAKNFVAANLSDIVYECVQQAQVKPGALNALNILTDMPETTVRVCSRIAFPGNEKRLESFYRNFSPCLDAVAHYELVSPFGSKRSYISNVNSVSANDSIYVVDDTPRNLEMAHMLRLNPVLVSENLVDWPRARTQYGARTFANLVEFAKFMMRQK